MHRPGGARAGAARRVLDLLRAEGVISRVELAERTGLTAATITNTVRPLVADGLVGEVGRDPQPGRGQPRRLLRLVAGAWHAVGIQVDRTSATIVVLDFAGARVATANLPGTGGRGPDATVAALADHVDSLLDRAGVARSRVLGVGLVTHGPQDLERGVLLTAQPGPEWLEYPLTGTLAERLGLPVLLENDANAAALGEMWAGAPRTDTFGLIYMASGIGGGVIVDGEVYRGRASNAVEIGHVALAGGSRPCVCGGAGCAQAEAAPHTVVARALGDRVLAERFAVTGARDGTLADFDRIARAWRAGDADAAAMLERSAHWIGQAAVTLVNLFDLDTVVLAGPAFAVAGTLYRDHVAAALERRALGRALSGPRVHVSSNAGSAAAHGGALHVLRTMPVGAPPRLPAAEPARGGAP
ncbi:ROK family transcriptional regulator [Glycomyces scopariae]|uniref:Sugar kinase of the NBD/HSP70 family, may contain an N-terminal HTH domain n=1 Tax=Glycomyces sambucus TaxID=380244 RepID=A0A1G9FTR2_9ACTN|nr:ROK family transcriptional regulator [Glycomyces sambucus]SDK91747.1 Sugar kinase of the NBD/HSP70 family, may contain an N-terminal HTH domain [Glycomyces sambucus]